MLKDVTEAFDAHNHQATFYCLPGMHSVHQELATDFRGNLGEFISTQQINIETCCLQLTVQVRITMCSWTDRHCFTPGTFRAVRHTVQTSTHRWDLGKNKGD